MSKILLLFFLTAVTSIAYGQSSQLLKDTSDSVAIALEQFRTENDAEVLSLFKGIRANPASGGVAVKIYLQDGSDYAYACHKHEISDPFECHRSN